MKDVWQFHHFLGLLSTGFNFLVCNFHLFQELVNINIKCPRVSLPAFWNTGWMFFACVVKNISWICLGLWFQSIAFLFVCLFLLLCLLPNTSDCTTSWHFFFSKCVWIWAFLPVPIRQNSCIPLLFTKLCHSYTQWTVTQLLPTSSLQAGNSYYIFPLNHHVQAILFCLSASFVTGEYIPAKQSQ